MMRQKTKVAAWTTADEIDYLNGVVARDGLRISDRSSVTVDAKLILSHWLTGCERRDWPATVNVAAARRECELLLESLE